MTKKQRLILVTIVAVIVLLFTLVTQSNKIPQEEGNVTVGELYTRMDGLRTLKEECVNNLNIADSARFLKGYTGYCDSWDAEITELRDQISVLSKKDYEGLR